MAGAGLAHMDGGLAALAQIYILVAPPAESSKLWHLAAATHRCFPSLRRGHLHSIGAKAGPTFRWEVPPDTAAIFFSNPPHLLPKFIPSLEGAHPQACVSKQHAVRCDMETAGEPRGHMHPPTYF